MFLGLQLFSILSIALPSYITLQTKIYTPTSTPLEAPVVNFQVTTLDPIGTCVLYVEKFSSVSMTSSRGSAVLNLGSGVQMYSATGPSYTGVFNNEAASLPCQGGGSYVPALNDKRRVVLQFHDGSAAGWQTAQMIDINSVPFASYAGDAQNLSGHRVTEFPLLSAFPDCSAGGKVLTFNGSAFTCVTGGSSGSVTSVTSTNSYISVATGTTTPAITANIGTAANTLAAGNDTRITGAAQKSNNLSDLASAATARTNLGLGTAATLSVGTTAGTVAAGDDGRITSAVQQAAYSADIANVLDSNCGSGSAPKWNVVADAWVCATIGSLDAAAITTGTLAAARLGSGTANASTYLRGDGSWSAVTSSQWTTNSNNIYYNTGNVGVGVTSPSAKVEVSGQVVSKVYNNGAATTFDFANGNAQYTTASCGAITLQNMIDGGAYTIAVQGATSGTCTFTDSAGSRTFKFLPANGNTTAGTHAIYSMQVMGSYVYVSWMSGF